MTNLKPYISTLMHVLELIIILVAAYSIVRFFNLGDTEAQAVVTIVLGAFAKFARAHDEIPVNDYVNKI